MKTYGEIRKNIESKLSKEIGMWALKGQIIKIRELAPLIAQGKMTYDHALSQIKAIVF